MTQASGQSRGLGDGPGVGKLEDTVRSRFRGLGKDAKGSGFYPVGSRQPLTVFELGGMDKSRLQGTVMRAPAGWASGERLKAGRRRGSDGD